MGVRRRFYRHLAAHLVEQGIGVVTYDYRGMGDSVLAGRRRPRGSGWKTGAARTFRLCSAGCATGMRRRGSSCWATPSAASCSASHRRCATSTHSSASPTQSGHWRHWDGLERAKVVRPLVRRDSTADGDERPLPVIAPRSRPGHSLRRRPPVGRVGPGQRLRAQPDGGPAAPVPRRGALSPADLPGRGRSTWPRSAPCAPGTTGFRTPNGNSSGSAPRNAAGRTIGHFGFFDPEVGADEWPGLTDFIRGG